MRGRRAQTLTWYILKELSGTFFFGVMAFTVLLVAGDLLFKIADLIIERGVSFWVVIRLFCYRLPSVVILTLPMACLLSTLLTFGRLSASNEMVALNASGVSFQRILKPVLIASLCVGVLSLLLNETLVPLSNRAAENLMKFEIAREKPSLLKERVFLRDESNGQLKRVIYISRLMPREGAMRDILIQEFTDGRLSRITTAEKGSWSNNKWTLEKGEVFQVDEKGTVELLYRFSSQQIELDLTPREVSRATRNPGEMGMFELIDHIRLVSKQGVNVQPLWVTLHLRIAVPLASIVLAIIGSAFGVTPQRRGTGFGFGLSILIVFAYYVVMSFSKSFGQSGHISPMLAAWIPNIMFSIFGIFLVRRVSH